MKVASLQEKQRSGSVRCLVCNHYCTIPEGKRGACGTKENISGVLYSLNYGKTVARALDPIEKKPLYKFLSGSLTYSFASPGCNFSCTWCQNSSFSQISPLNPADGGHNISPAEHVQAALSAECSSISYTYSEPTIFLEYALETMRLAKNVNLKNIWVSNGYMSAESMKLILPLLDAANVDLKGDEQVYRNYCGGKLEPIKQNLELLCRAGIHLELTTLIVPGVNDSPELISELAEYISQKLNPDIPWHLTRFFPAWQEKHRLPTPLETIRKAEKIAKKYDLRNIYLGNI